MTTANDNYLSVGVRVMTHGRHPGFFIVDVSPGGTYNGCIAGYYPTSNSLPFQLRFVGVRLGVHASWVIHEPTRHDCFLLDQLLVVDTYTRRLINHFTWSPLQGSKRIPKHVLTSFYVTKKCQL